MNLNGAQTQAALDIISKVASGDIPRDSGVQSLEILFGMTQQQAERLLPADNQIVKKMDGVTL